ncbi:hypothetical protein [Neobacillus cucumis]|uniref:hypothetical protein n=1 Tax=Neobacillus cucumis TaxID=1740721 RepID=UPI001964DD2E|nr:hypothetical protein [Neobacillus cucumis]MBM7654568.1 hypothetical protein [Neobacillus cucumis]
MKAKRKKHYLPETIILKRLACEPYKTIVPVHGGMFDAEVTVLPFFLRYKDAVVELLFDELDDNKSSLCDIDFAFKGMKFVKPELWLSEFYRKKEKEKLTILEQAITILKDRQDLIRYQKEMENQTNWFKGKKGS